MAERAERTVHLLIPKVIDTIVFVISPESDELEALGRSCIDATKLPLQGIVREAIDSNKTVIKATVGTEDPIVELLPSAGQLKSTQRVILSPLQKDGKLVAFIVVVCIISGDTLSYLDYIEQQILQSYHHITERRRYVYEFEWQKAFLEFFSKSYEKEVGPLSRKIGEFLQTQTNAETSAILILDHTAGELHNKQESSNSTQEKRIEVSGSIFEEVIQSKTKLTVFNIGEEKKYRNDLQKITDCSVHSMLCVPIVSIKTGIVIAVACVFNKKLNKGRFSSSEEDNAVFCCENIAAHVEHTLEWEREMVIKRQQEHLLKVAKNLFTLVDDVSVLLSEIMTEARKLTNAERCSVFLWDKERDELVAKVFDGEIPNDGTSINGKRLLEWRSCVTRLMELNLTVALLTGSCFTKFDEDLTRAFAIYCGVSIFHNNECVAKQASNPHQCEYNSEAQSLLYKNAKEAYNRSRLSSEMMIYHMTVTQSEVDLLFSKKICSTKEIHPEFCLFSSTPRNILQDSMIPACLCMFEDLGMIEKWKIPKEVLVRFLLMVRKGYRNPPYHNWIHAFTVAHFCYLLFKNARITHQLRDIELLALFVACLCHDIDHRGTTNSFQVSSGSTLAALYSSKGSVLERHHFAQTMCILNSEGCNIFKNLTGKDYKDVFILIRDIILATDLAHHLRILQDLRKMAELTKSVLRNHTVKYLVVKMNRGLIYSEFFSQGDKEKHMGLTPMEMMDRERAVIPKLQIDFLDAIALPVYRLLSSLLPETQEVLETVLSNRQKWQKAQEDGDYVYRPVATSDKEIQLTVNGSVPDTCQ
ncbi:cGMP-dependent 3' [Acropora cervicornis]|uniref:Phosphodiesterase n=1 Tax=Acropora cervicornis TaxID=6130 RepID=A0AAD9QM57_ACRCE|nr:cGMP-dependent 3' [Acropora cervicornis]